MKLLLACTACLLLGHVTLGRTARGQDAADSSDVKKLLAKRTFERDGGHLNYRLLEPADAGETRFPLVIFLHGIGERGSDNAKQLCNGVEHFATAAARAKHPCFLVVPQCPPEATWSPIKGTRENPAFEEAPTAPAALLLGLIEELVAGGRVDPDRLYVTGLSMGGYGTWDLVTRRPDLFAAAVPVCGGGDPARAAALVGLPIRCYHGAADFIVPVERSRAMIAAIEKAGGKPEYTEYEGVGHDSWTKAYGEPALLDWLFAQKRSAR